ncbi:hypothetical protein [Butyrivibrio proteoclasticus]|uniref:hypothetical protein n=1 Tax=Butyrivibrio proteoclasticus TaxID=43305 RepID=UPI00047964E5|nr:hypothetical protein [Butyrivibrio proteoclasticus]
MKKKKLGAIAIALAIAGALATCTGCSLKLSDYVDEETASEIASFGKSLIVEKGSEVVTEMVSDVASSSSSLISQIIEESKTIAEQEASGENSGGSTSGENPGGSTSGENPGGNTSGDNTAGNESAEESQNNSGNTAGNQASGILTSTADIGLTDSDGKGKNYVFTYGDSIYTAIYWDDHWKIMDSYLIGNSNDMIIICQALIDLHPIHGADHESYRTADDMAYEWLQHNIAYEFLPEDNVWRQKSKDVDFNPDDQGKSFIEIYEQRTGKEFKWSDITGS